MSNSNKVLLHVALIVLALTLAVTGCRRATPVAAPPADTAPSFAATVADQSYAVGAAIRLTLPEASGGNGALRYTLGPEVPPGLSFDAAARTLSGTPELEGVYEMTYGVEDSDDNTSAADSATLAFTITVNPATAVATVITAVRAGAADGVLRFASLPQPGTGPAVVEVGGSFVIANGGAFFLDVVADQGVDKLLVSLGEEGFGYYEIDLPDSAAASQRLVGHLAFDLDPGMSPLCLSLTAVNQDGTAGPPVCHTMFIVPVASGELQITVSWDAISDLDLHVVDAHGDEIYFGRTAVQSGGILDLKSSCDDPSGGIIRNEHVVWPDQSPPPGTYVVRVNHWTSCDVPETNYIVRVDYRGETSTFSGKFTGDGERGGRGAGEVITIFTTPGAAPPPAAVTELPPLHYRGHGDQVFVLNPEGETLDDTLVTLELGDAAAEVYLIATNGAHYPMDPNVERLDLREAAAKGLRAASTEEYEPQARPAMTAPVADRPWVTEFNNNPPLLSRVGVNRRSARLLQEAEPGLTEEEPGVMEGDTFAFRDLDDDFNVVEIPATARKVVSDGTMTVAVWVADADWTTACEPHDGDGSATLQAAHFVPKVCVTQEMVDALGAKFLQPGAGNDIYDWVTAIFGDPWGPHDIPILIPAEAAGEIHILLFDISGDGLPEPGEPRIVGFFFSKDNFLYDPENPFLALSNERLMFYLDAPFLTIAEGDTWEVTDRLPSIMIGTLAHEFQHMIHFYQKQISHGGASEAWLNEMASEVAEDLIADKMEGAGPRSVAYDDPTAGEPGNTRGRLPGFNLYNDIQVTRWDGLLANYDINYALGAYLARNYGGAALFSAIVQSEHSGTAAIEAALKDLGHDISFGQALENWSVAVLRSNDTSAPVPYRYNAGDWITSRAGGMEFRMGSINLYHYAYGEPRVPARLAWEGPYLHSLNSMNERTQPPHSVAYSTLGRNSGTMRLSVSAVGDNRITAVVKE